MSVLVKRLATCCFIPTDAHFLLVVAVSLVLCLFLFLLVRAYGRNIRYRGKERQIQRPFIKGKRGLQTPRSPVLLGNLVGFLNVMFYFH